MLTEEQIADIRAVAERVEIIGRAVLVQADCRAILPFLPRVDAVVTDPPYGIDYSGGRTQVVNTKEYGKLKNDTLQGECLGNLICNIFLFIKEDADAYICVSPIMQKPFLDFIESSGRKLSAVIVWDKKNAGLGYMAYRRRRTMTVTA